MKNKSKNTENHENIDLAGLMQVFLLIYWGGGQKSIVRRSKFIAPSLLLIPKYEQPRKYSTGKIFRETI